MIVVPYTFQCKELLFVLGRMMPPPDLSDPGTATEAAAQLANTISRNVIVVDDQEVLVELDEPVEAVAFARQFELRIERCIASPLALDLIRESGEPARSSWQWLCQRIGLTAMIAPSLVHVRQLPRDRLPEGVDQIPDGPGAYVWIIGLQRGGDQIVFIDRSQTLGSDADVRIADKTLGRVHSAIVPYRGTWAIEDRNSLSGTFVDGNRVASRCLVPGMTIRMGAATQLVVLSVR